jgi:cell wall-associated NlpC family hydrolase
VLDQFALLDRAQTYNANILTDIRDYRREVDRSQRVLNRERNARRDAVAELSSLKSQIRSSIASDKQRYHGLRAKVRQLIEARRQAEIRASRRIAERQRQLQAAAQAQAADVNDIGGMVAATPSAGDTGGSSSDAVAPPPSSAAQAAVQSALSQLGVPYVWGGSSPGSGFDCSGLVSWAYGQQGIGLPHFTGALWNSGTHVSSSDLAPGDLVFYNGLNHVGMYIGSGNFVEAPHTGDVVKISSMGARSGFVGAVRISG